MRFPQFADQRGGKPRAAGTQRVADGDRAAVHVHLRRVDAELLDGEQRDGGEGLVDLEEVDVGEPSGRPWRGLLDGADRGPVNSSGCWLLVA